MSDAQPPKKETYSIAITDPAINGDRFEGVASGDYSPADNAATCDFWHSAPGPSDPPDAEGTMSFDGTTWSASFDMSGVAATTTGYLRAVNVTAADFKRSLQWEPPTS